MSTWSSKIGKFQKKDPNHGWLWEKIKHWFCKVGLCNLNKCKCGCHCKGRSAAWNNCTCNKGNGGGCNNPNCKCSN